MILHVDLETVKRDKYVPLLCLGQSSGVLTFDSVCTNLGSVFHEEFQDIHETLVSSTVQWSQQPVRRAHTNEGNHTPSIKPTSEL